jgi:hypothetical protein
MKNVLPETLTLDRLGTPVGEVLLVTDADGAVRALDFVDYEPRMMRLLGRHAPGATLQGGRAPEAVRAAVEAYFAGDAKALDRLTVRTAGTAFQTAVWAALRAIPGADGPDVLVLPFEATDFDRIPDLVDRAWTWAQRDGGGVDGLRLARPAACSG